MRQEIELRHGKVVFEIPDEKLEFTDDELVGVKRGIEAVLGSAASTCESLLRTDLSADQGVISLDLLEEEFIKALGPWSEGLDQRFGFDVFPE